MRPQDITDMKLSGKLKLNFGQLMDHYSILILLLMIPLFMSFSLIEIYITKTYDGIRTGEEIIHMAWPWLLPTLFFYFSQRKRLRFELIELEYTEKQFKEALKRTAKEHNWKIERDSPEILVARRKWNWSFSWGEMITILKDKNRLYLNSICDPDQRSSVTSFGWNKRNIRTFLGHLEAVKAGKRPEKKSEPLEKEWSIKRILTRAIAYPFCLGLIGFGFTQIFNPENSRSTAMGIGALAVAGVYLYTDLRLILTKRAN